jgi:hypothetical protein
VRLKRLARTILAPDVPRAEDTNHRTPPTDYIGEQLRAQEERVKPTWRHWLPGLVPYLERWRAGNVR